MTVGRRSVILGGILVPALLAGCATRGKIGTRTEEPKPVWTSHRSVPEWAGVKATNLNDTPMPETIYFSGVSDAKVYSEAMARRQAEGNAIAGAARSIKQTVSTRLGAAAQGMGASPEDSRTYTDFLVDALSRNLNLQGLIPEEFYTEKYWDQSRDAYYFVVKGKVTISQSNFRTALQRAIAESEGRAEEEKKAELKNALEEFRKEMVGQ